MIALLNEIASIAPKDLNEVKLKEISEKFRKYYFEHDRHSYAEVSMSLYSLREDDIEYVVENLIKVHEYFKKYDQDNFYANKIFKLIDHIKLERIRFSHFLKLHKEDILDVIRPSIDDLLSHTEETINSFYLEMNKKNREMSNKNEEVNNNLQSVKEEQAKLISNFEDEQTKLVSNFKLEMDKLNNNLISILGIFSAIIVSFFSGISFLGSALNNMHQVTIYKLLLVVIITGCIIFNIIAMLLYYIAKLSGKDIGKGCSRNRCAICNSKSYFECFKDKYTLIYYFNLSCIICSLILLGIYMIGKFDVPIGWFSDTSINMTTINRITWEIGNFVSILSIVTIVILMKFSFLSNRDR